MDDKQKDEFLYDLYYNKKMALGRDSLFFYVSKTLKNTQVSRRYIQAWLAKQETHQLHTQRKKATNIRPINSGGRPGALLSIDLIDFSNKKSNGFSYILNVMDIFSRKVWLNEIRRKDIKSVIPALNNIIEDIQKDYKVNVIQSDNGPEFNISFPTIKHIQSRPYTPQQNPVERANRTVKSILNRLMTADKSKQWQKYLVAVEEAYNSSYNTNLKMSPDEAYQLDPDQQIELQEKQKNIKARGYKEINTVLKVGDTVRIVNEKEQIKKKGDPIWSRELYKIKSVIPANKLKNTIPRYKVISEENKLQRNTFPLSKLLLIPGVETK